MTAQKFELVFQKISLSLPLLEAFQGTEVRKLTIHKKERTVSIEIAANKMIPLQKQEELKGALLESLPGIQAVSLAVFYELTDKTPEALAAGYWGSIKTLVSQKSKICAGVIADAEWRVTEHKLQILVKHNMAYYLAQKHLDDAIANMIHTETGETLLVQFKNQKATEADRAALENNRKKKFEELSRQIITTQAEAVQEKANAEVAAVSSSVSKGILLGKEINGANQKIIDTKILGENVIIEGSIYNIEPREIRGEKYIVSFDITDLSDSTTVKFFVKKSVFDAELSDKIKKGKYLRVQGEVQFDKYTKEIDIMAKNIMTAAAPAPRMDDAEEKRVELHLHTQMSSMDGVTPVKKYIERAIAWGHKAIAITDHGVVQAFPDAMNAIGKSDLKVIYGVEAYLIDDLGSVVTMPRGQSLDDTFVVFDIETTGLSKETESITEIGAVKVVDGKIIDRFSTFVNPERPIPAEITKLTGITNEMVADAPVITEILPKFLEFCQDAVLVAHNANFDTGFIRLNAERKCGIEVKNTVLDTLELSRSLLPELKKHKLDIVCEQLGVSLEGHHRAVNDAEATAEVFLKFIDMLVEKEIYKVDDINVFSSQTVNYKKLKAYHAIILAKDYVGLRNLYELISLSHIDYYFRRPRIPKSKLIQHREGLILGSACEAGELYRALLDKKPKQVIEELVNFYDYLEIQPLGNNRFMIESPKVESVHSMEDIIAINKQIVALGEEHNKPVVATCDVHFIDPQDAAFRKIIMAAEGFADADKQAPLYFRTTKEMLKEFTYLGEEKAREIVITNTNKIADMIEKIKPIPDDTFPPKIEGADEELRQICMDKAISIYGDPLPPIVQDRLETELNSIISNGYAVLYIIAQKLVWKSVADGYLVGSRGSVGSSFAANMAGITEVNSLPPHYICDHCKYSDFESETVKAFAMEEASGCDMPDKDCPVCGHKLRKDGHDIPFQTFLGFEGDKEPDIDLNFSGDYQPTAHKYTEELFGRDNVCRAGTISTIAIKTAFGYVKKYYEAKNLHVHSAHVAGLVEGFAGIKRTTGQHPGGIMVVPRNMDIHYISPMNRPADEKDSETVTTHFDYHSINDRLVKLDILGHDDPTVIKMLEELTNIPPQQIPVGDEKTMSIFRSTEAFGVTPEQIGSAVGTYGIPECGTQFVRQMIQDVQPKNFSQVVRVSGYSHGTDVWLNNAQDLIREGKPSEETISTRDDIMTNLIAKGVDPSMSFKIMEYVRKGKAAKGGLEAPMLEAMRAAKVPEWYIESCNKVQYLFPKAHAVAYVMMAYRIAYCKVHYPREFYAAYFTVRAPDFDMDHVVKGVDYMKRYIKDVYAQGYKASNRDKDTVTYLELVIEMLARGFEMERIDLYKSHPTRFTVTEKGLRPPLAALGGIGVTAAQSISEAREIGHPFISQEDLRVRAKVGKAVVEKLAEHGALGDLPETDQIDLF